MRELLRSEVDDVYKMWQQRGGDEGRALDSPPSLERSPAGGKADLAGLPPQPRPLPASGAGEGASPRSTSPTASSEPGPAANPAIEVRRAHTGENGAMQTSPGEAAVGRSPSDWLTLHPQSPAITWEEGWLLSDIQDLTIITSVHAALIQEARAGCAGSPAHANLARAVEAFGKCVELLDVKRASCESHLDTVRQDLIDKHPQVDVFGTLMNFAMKSGDHREDWGSLLPQSLGQAGSKAVAVHGRDAATAGSGDRGSGTGCVWSEKDWVNIWKCVIVYGEFAQQLYRFEGVVRRMRLLHEEMREAQADLLRRHQATPEPGRDPAGADTLPPSDQAAPASTRASAPQDAADNQPPSGQAASGSTAAFRPEDAADNQPPSGQGASASTTASTPEEAANNQPPLGQAAPASTSASVPEEAAEPPSAGSHPARSLTGIPRASPVDETRDPSFQQQSPGLPSASLDMDDDLHTGPVPRVGGEAWAAGTCEVVREAAQEEEEDAADALTLPALIVNPRDLLPLDAMRHQKAIDEAFRGSALPLAGGLDLRRLVPWTPPGAGAGSGEKDLVHPKTEEDESCERMDSAAENSVGAAARYMDYICAFVRHGGEKDERVFKELQASSRALGGAWAPALQRGWSWPARPFVTREASFVEALELLFFQASSQLSCSPGVPGGRPAGAAGGPPGPAAGRDAPASSSKEAASTSPTALTTAAPPEAEAADGGGRRQRAAPAPPTSSREGDGEGGGVGEADNSQTTPADVSQPGWSGVDPLPLLNAVTKMDYAKFPVVSAAAVEKGFVFAPRSGTLVPAGTSPGVRRRELSTPMLDKVCAGLEELQLAFAGGSCGVDFAERVRTLEQAMPVCDIEMALLGLDLLGKMHQCMKMLQQADSSLTKVRKMVRDKGHRSRCLQLKVRKMLEQPLEEATNVKKQAEDLKALIVKWTTVLGEQAQSIAAMWKQIRERDLSGTPGSGAPRALPPAPEAAPQVGSGAPAGPASGGATSAASRGEEAADPLPSGRPTEDDADTGTAKSAAPVGATEGAVRAPSRSGEASRTALTNRESGGPATDVSDDEASLSKAYRSLAALGRCVADVVERALDERGPALDCPAVANLSWLTASMAQLMRVLNTERGRSIKDVCEIRGFFKKGHASLDLVRTVVSLVYFEGHWADVGVTYRKERAQPGGRSHPADPFVQKLLVEEPPEIVEAVAHYLTCIQRRYQRDILYHNAEPMWKMLVQAEEELLKRQHTGPTATAQAPAGHPEAPVHGTPAGTAPEGAGELDTAPAPGAALRVGAPHDLPLEDSAIGASASPGVPGGEAPQEGVDAEPLPAEGSLRAAEGPPPLPAPAGEPGDPATPYLVYGIYTWYPPQCGPSAQSPQRKSRPSLPPAEPSTPADPSRANPHAAKAARVSNAKAARITNAKADKAEASKGASDKPTTTEGPHAVPHQVSPLEGFPVPANSTSAQSAAAGSQGTASGGPLQETRGPRLSRCRKYPANCGLLWGEAGMAAAVGNVDGFVEPRPGLYHTTSAPGGSPPLEWAPVTVLAVLTDVQDAPEAGGGTGGGAGSVERARQGAGTAADAAAGPWAPEVEEQLEMRDGGGYGVGPGMGSGHLGCLLLLLTKGRCGLTPRQKLKLEAVLEQADASERVTRKLGRVLQRRCHPCWQCGMWGCWSTCARCKAAFYCCAAHQHADWLSHKQSCRPAP
eukprot:jgi/Botrbrau1/19516/Bobra.0035s0016.1